MIVGMTIRGVSPIEREPRDLDVYIKGEEAYIGIRVPDKERAEWAIWVPLSELREVIARLRPVP